MTIRKFNITVLLGSVVFLQGIAVNSFAGEIFEPTVKLVTAETAALCGTEGNNITCDNFSLASVIGGQVQKVISGRIVDGTKFSWIAQTDEKNFLCVANSIDDVICKDMQFKNSRALDLDYVGSGDKSRFVFRYPWNDEKSQEYLRSAASVFQIKYLRALKKINRAHEKTDSAPAQKSSSTDIASTNSCGNEIQCDGDGSGDIPVVIIDAPYPDPEPGPWVGGGTIEFPPIFGGGGGSGGDGTTGTSMANNRGPQCDRENEFMDRTMARVYDTGNFVGTQVPIIVTDPNYGDGQWIKIQAYEIQHYWKQGMTTRQEFRLNMHYMYNVTTRMPHQTKLKNSYESGCVGFPVPL